MTHSDRRVRPLHTPAAARTTLLVLTTVALVLVALVVKPFAAALFMAAIMAAVFHPWCEGLVRLLRGRRAVAAGLMTASALLVVVLPLAAISVTLAKDVAEGAAYVRKTLRSEGTEGIVRDLPSPLRALARKVLDQLPQDQQDLQQLAQGQSGRAAAAVGGALTATWGIVVQLVLMLIALYFFLLEGARLVDWAEDVVPLRHGQTRRLLSEFRKVSVAVIVSSVATAGIQAFVALAGYLVAKVPNPFFFGIVTFIVGLVPAVGAGAVTLFAAAILFLSGHSGAALFLALWGIFAVGLIDNVVKPYLIRGGVELHGAVVFFALLGGLAYFGPVGLVAGPLVMSFFLAVVRMWEPDPVEQPASG